MTPASDPDANRRHDFSCCGLRIRTLRICSYATNLIAAYGKIRSSVAECPRNSPSSPSCRRISCTAWKTPDQLPEYLRNFGFEAWKRILTRSSGAMRVFAWKM